MKKFDAVLLLFLMVIVAVVASAEELKGIKANEDHLEEGRC